MNIYTVFALKAHIHYYSYAIDGMKYALVISVLLYQCFVGYFVRRLLACIMKIFDGERKGNFIIFEMYLSIY